MSEPGGRARMVWTVGLAVAGGFLAGLLGVAVGWRIFAPPSPAQATARYQPPPAPMPVLNPVDGDGGSIVAAVAVARPAVVNIDSIGRRGRQRRPWEQGPQPESEGVIGSGSGFIFDAPNGYVMTNQHVIEHATSVTVGLGDERELPAKVVGSDPMSDIAVLRIEADNLPAVPLGLEAPLAAGQWVIAIGNPFGDFTQTVTVGVISALGRGLETPGGQDRYYRNLIQTDAAINMGNSGGPLINIDGQVIGINSAIFSPGGLNIGIGFAIPITDAMHIARHLIEHGGVPWLGVIMVDLDAEVAESLGIEQTEGVLLDEIVRGSPAAAAGLAVDDIVVAVAGDEVKTGRDLELKILSRDIGEEVKVTVLRDGKRRDLKVKLGTRPNG